MLAALDAGGTAAASSVSEGVEQATCRHANRTRLRGIRHRHGLLATGDTPPAPPPQDWLTARQRALLGQSPFVEEAALLALRRKEAYLEDKEAEYTKRAQELARRIEAAQHLEINGWEEADELSASDSAVLGRCVEELADVEKFIADIDVRLSEIAAEEDRLRLLLEGHPNLEPDEELRIKQRLLDLQAERQKLEERKQQHLRRREALRKTLQFLKYGQVPDAEELDLEAQQLLSGNREIPDRFPWETDPAWLAVQGPRWSYELADKPGQYISDITPKDPAALARAHIAACQTTRRRCTELAQAAASVAHKAVESDLLEDYEAASILYRKATVLLEQAADEATSERGPLGGVHALGSLAKQWMTKAREYWARADLLSGQAEIDNMFFMLDTNGDGAIDFSEFKDGFAYLEERLSRMADPAAPHQQRFSRYTDRWSVLDVARWLEEHVGVGQVASAFVAGRVDGLLLQELDEDDLIELGVNSGIVRKKILLALAQLSDASYEAGGGSVTAANTIAVRRTQSYLSDRDDSDE